MTSLLRRVAAFSAEWTHGSTRAGRALTPAARNEQVHRSSVNLGGELIVGMVERRAIPPAGAMSSLQTMHDPSEWHCTAHVPSHLGEDWHVTRRLRSDIPERANTSAQAVCDGASPSHWIASRCQRQIPPGQTVAASSDRRAGAPVW